MANLLDAIRQNRPQGVTDESQRIAQLLRAKSGKQVAAPEVGGSNLAEAAAVGQAQQEFDQTIMPQAQVQQAGQDLQRAGQAQEFQIQKAGIAQERRFNDVENKLKTTELLNSFERDQGSLDYERNKAAVEQFAQGLRLQNARYISDLQREGARNRLNTEIGFNEALAEDMFGANKELLEKQLGNRSILDATDRDYKTMLSRMGVQDAWAAWDRENAAEKKAAEWKAIGMGTQAGIGAAGTASEESAKKDYYTSGDGKNDTSYEASKYRDKVE